MHRFSVEPADMRPAAHFAPHEAGALEHLDVFRRGGKRDGEGGCKLAHQPLARRQILQHRPPRRVGERMEYGVEPIVHIFNHII
ncbi:hypothetical protein D3C71_1879130 [compost metagenome]